MATEGPDRDRLPILQVGTIRHDPDRGPGGAFVDDWTFGLPESDSGPLPIAPLGNLFGGWTAEELHVIAHGHPCGCGIGSTLGGR